MIEEVVPPEEQVDPQPAPLAWTPTVEPGPEFSSDIMLAEYDRVDRQRLWLLAQRAKFLNNLNRLEKENAALREQVAALMPPETDAEADASSPGPEGSEPHQA